MQQQCTTALKNTKNFEKSKNLIEIQKI